jgi:hypothetical protein
MCGKNQDNFTRTSNSVMNIMTSNVRNEKKKKINHKQNNRENKK